MRITKIIAKIAFIIIAVVLPFYDVWSFFKEETAVDIEPIAAGMYDVKVFVLNKDTLAPLLTDTIRWKDIIFQKGGIGSVNNRGVFKQRYGRGYFNYKMDSLKHTIDFLGFNEDEDVLFTLNYKIEKDNTIKLNGKFKSDSIYIDLVKSKHHFQLSEKQFHWLSEHNR